MRDLSTRERKLLTEYAPKLRELLPLAQSAFGSRNTISPQHTASREYTALLVSYASKDGSLQALADELGVTYAGLRRRIVMDKVPASSHRPRPVLSEKTYHDAVARIGRARKKGTIAYHEQLLNEFESGLSMDKIAKLMGLSGANPLYYGLQRARARRMESTH